MKFLVLIALAVACVVADPEPGISEWRAEYGAYPSGKVVQLNYEAPLLKDGAPLLRYGAPFLRYDAPMYYRLAPKAYSLPAGYRVSYDPEKFNDAFGFYPAYKK